jgi:hypothetical protein
MDSLAQSLRAFRTSSSPSSASIATLRVAPVEARRLRRTQDTDEVAAEQGLALVERLPEPEALPIFAFDAGYDPVKLQRALEEYRRRFRLAERGSSCWMYFYFKPLMLGEHVEIRSRDR